MSAAGARRWIGVFCGAKLGHDPAFAGIAREAGRGIAARGWGLVYGGGSVGLMGVLADAALAGGAEVVGVIPDVLMRREVGHRGLTRLEVVADMAVRKQRLIALSDAFLVLPGGFGTLDELFEVVTLRQLGQHDKPLAFADPGGYWTALLAACAGLTRHGLLAERDHASLEAFDSVDAALARLASDRPA
ncbi:MAG: TIGR00730 family Rossman fold protein [Lautropia sp.]